MMDSIRRAALGAASLRPEAPAGKTLLVAAPTEDPDILFTVPDLNSHRRMEMIADGMSARGHSDRVIEKVIGGTWVRLMREVWGT